MYNQAKNRFKNICRQKVMDFKLAQATDTHHCKIFGKLVKKYEKV